MKKLCAAFTLLLILPLCLCACGKDANPNETTAFAPLHFPAAPPEYKPVLDDLLLQVQMSLGQREPIPDEIIYMYFFPAGAGSPRAVGYAVKDINNDGTQELIILCNNTEAPTLMALFTLKDDKPVLLQDFDSRNEGALAANGTLYCVGDGGVMHEELKAYRLAPDAVNLTLMAEYQSDLSNSEAPLWYKIVDGEKKFITQAEFEALKTEYLNPPDPMQFEFIPIEQ